MANSVSSELTISTAVSVLGDILAPLNAFTKNISSEVVGRQAKIKVPVISTDDVARDFTTVAPNAGYGVNAETSVDLVDVDIVERIKPFHLLDNDMNKSPLTLQSYARQNAHEFGRYLLNVVFKALDTSAALSSGGVKKATRAIGSVALTDVKTIAGNLDSAGASTDRHLILNSTAVNNLLPATIETYGTSVFEGGRFNDVYGMNVHKTSVNDGTATGKVHSFGCSSDAIVIVNRMPDVSGGATLEEYTPFTIEGLGIQCAYRRYYDASMGDHFGAFTANFGVSIVKPDSVSVLRS
jgi:hypothetical protein